ncbi:MAG TPA: hypothetical protein QF423_04275, partial [Candidatus Scalindua sp.]|nr:hypothetical protein [Candidatus Scalindua sp.]
MKREEEKSYAGLYLLLSFILVLTMAWAMWDEAVGKRPWKMYQTRFYELEQEKARGEYGKATVKLKSQRPSLQAYQVHLEDINEADRCMSCHVGINRRESVSEDQPYASHPRRDVYLGNHPSER